MNTNINSTVTIREYMAFNLAFEYEGYTGYEKYAIATNLSEEELRAKYGEDIESFEPFILISWEAGMIMREHNNNEAKYRMRMIRGIEVQVCEIFDDVYKDETTIVQNNLEIRNEYILEALNLLNERLRSRIISKYFDELTETEIAIANGCSQQQVSKDIKKALKQLEVILDGMGVHA